MPTPYASRGVRGANATSVAHDSGVICQRLSANDRTSPKIAIASAGSGAHERIELPCANWFRMSKSFVFHLR